MQLLELHNAYWQSGILPSTGASIAYGRIAHEGRWVDLMRPTAPENWDNSSHCASFLLIPWSNRIRDGVLLFEGETYRLRTERDDGTARHGDVRNRPWQVLAHDALHARLAFDSADHPDINFPFHFSAEVVYRLDGRDYIWEITVHNRDTRRFPLGFGHHPYFLRAPDGADNAVQLSVPYNQQYTLTNAMPDEAAGPLKPEMDFRHLRPLGDTILDDLFTDKTPDIPLRLVYPAWRKALHMTADAIFSHLILFAPPQKPFFAVEPVTNANDGFNLYAKGIPNSGVHVLEVGASLGGRVVWSIHDMTE